MQFEINKNAAAVWHFKCNIQRIHMTMKHGDPPYNNRVEPTARGRHAFVSPHALAA